MTAPCVLALLQEYRGVSAWRCIWPIEELARQGHPAAWGWNSDPRASVLIEQADAVLLHRPAWTPGDELKAIAWRDLLHAGGKCIIVDYDDDLLSPEFLQRTRATGDAALNAKSDEQLERERQARIFALRLADGVTCSTGTLAAVCRRYTDKPVIVVPNAIDLPRFLAGLVDWQRTVPGLTIGWAGMNRPDSDAVHLAEAWGRIAARFPEVTFVVAGFPLAALVNAVPSDRLVVLPELPLDTYARNYAEIDIGCCTLADDVFARAKSPIKAMEFAAAGAAVVASPTVYGDFARHTADMLIAESADSWEFCLTALIELPELRLKMAQDLLARVERDHTLAANIGKWLKAWAEILTRFDATRDAEVVAFA